MGGHDVAAEQNMELQKIFLPPSPCLLLCRIIKRRKLAGNGCGKVLIFCISTVTFHLQLKLRQNARGSYSKGLGKAMMHLKSILLSTITLLTSSNDESVT